MINKYSLKVAFGLNFQIFLSHSIKFIVCFNKNSFLHSDSLGAIDVYSMLNRKLHGITLGYLQISLCFTGSAIYDRAENERTNKLLRTVIKLK